MLETFIMDTGAHTNEEVEITQADPVTPLAVPPVKKFKGTAQPLQRTGILYLTS